MSNFFVSVVFIYKIFVCDPLLLESLPLRTRPVKNKKKYTKVNIKLPFLRFFKKKYLYEYTHRKRIYNKFITL